MLHVPQVVKSYIITTDFKEAGILWSQCQHPNTLTTKVQQQKIGKMHESGESISIHSK